MQIIYVCNKKMRIAINNILLYATSIYALGFNKLTNSFNALNISYYTYNKFSLYDYLLFILAKLTLFCILNPFNLGSGLYFLITLMVIYLYINIVFLYNYKCLLSIKSFTVLSLKSGFIATIFYFVLLLGVSFIPTTLIDILIEYSLMSDSLMHLSSSDYKTVWTKALNLMAEKSQFPFVPSRYPADVQDMCTFEVVSRANPLQRQFFIHVFKEAYIQSVSSNVQGLGFSKLLHNGELTKLGEFFEQKYLISKF